MDTYSLKGPRIALLIDFDNVILGVEEPPGFDIELVVTALRSRGQIVLGRAYGDWYRHNRHRRRLMDHGIELVETPAFGPVIKNSADIRIALDAFEIGMTQDHIDEFCLVSGDSDFLPLIKRLQYLGKTVTVISGVKFTSDLVRRNCNEFISYENLLAESVGAAEDATVLEGAFALLVRTIHALNERGMEVRSSTVKQMMIQLNPVFSERTFGCTQFKQFLDKACRAGLIRLGRRESSSGEYTVHLLSENGDTDSDETEETESTASTSRRSRSRRTQTSKAESAREGADSSQPEEKEKEADSSSAEHVEAGEKVEEKNTGTGRITSAREALRQGRLRSSGRTWKGKATTRSILQGALSENSAAAETESAEKEKLETDQEDKTTSEESPADSKESTSDEKSASKAVMASSEVDATAEEPTSEKEAPAEKPEAEEQKTEPKTEKTSESEETSREEKSEKGEGKEAEEKAPAPEAEPAAADEEKPKRVTRRRKTTKKSAEETAEEPTKEPTGEAEESESKPAQKRATKTASKSAKKPAAKKSTKKSGKAAKAEAAAETNATAEAAPESDSTEATEKTEGTPEKKAAKKPTRRRTTRKKKEETKEGETQEKEQEEAPASVQE